MTRRSVPKSVGVYEPGTPSYFPPDRYIDPEDARRLARNGEANRINRGSAIRLRISSSDAQGEKPIHLRAESCRPGPSQMQAIAEGNFRARSTFNECKWSSAAERFLA